MEDGRFKTIPLPSHDPQMSKEDASVYYSEKCRAIFLDLGFMYEEEDDFEEKLEVAFLEVRVSTNKMLQREVKKIQVLLCSGLGST